MNSATGERERLTRPPISGLFDRTARETNPPASGVTDMQQLDAIIDWFYPLPEAGVESDDDNGRLELARILATRFGAEKFPYMSVISPLWRCYQLWGFEGLMLGLFEFPDLVRHACERILDHSLRQVEQCAAAGSAGIWLEECLTDMINPEQFRRLNLPLIRSLTDAIRAKGMYSIYYYCGNPRTRWGLLLDSGADALALEEGKKDFQIDIVEVAERVRGEMAILGNLDSIAVLERGSEEELRCEIARQLQAGRKNRNRFVMSIGSPVTPATPLDRVRLYCDMVHERGKS